MHPLNYDIRLSNDGSYIIAELEGLVDHENATCFVQDALDMVVETGIDKVLIDSRNARNIDSIPEDLRFLRPSKMIDNPDSKKLARVVLVDAEDRSHDFVIRALLRKGHNIVISRDESRAIGMLTDGG
tara:strand:- start:1028 stop:1411 length:384 start_codon:yes stop_codon:yes gene_type:complete